MPRTEVPLRFTDADHRAAFLAQADAMVKVIGPLQDAAVEVIGDDVVIAVETDSPAVAAIRADLARTTVCEGSTVPVPEIAGADGGWTET